MTVAKHGVTTNTAHRVLIDAGAVYLGFEDADAPGTLLGATRGGNVFEVTRVTRDVRPDGAKGPVKGFRRIEDVVAKLTVNLLEITAENLRRALAATYTSGTTPITDESVGTGNGTQVNFDLDYDNVVDNSETVKVNSVVKTRGVDYTMDYTNGVIQFFVAPADTLPITASYSYVSAAAVMTGQEIADNKHIWSVALVGELAGYSNPVILKIKEAICEPGFNLKLAPKDEAVTELTFVAHYTDTALETEPWEIEYPAS